MKNRSSRGKMRSVNNDEDNSFGKRSPRKRKISRHQSKKMLKDVKQGNLDENDYEENMQDYNQWSD